MTQPINTFQDILDALERDPELRKRLKQHILTEDLLNLPAVVGQLEADQPPLTDQVRNLTGQVENLDSRVEGLAGQVENLDSRVEGLAGQVENLDSRVEGLNEKVENLDHRVEGLAGQVENLAESVGQPEPDQPPLTGQVGRLAAATRLMESRWGNIEGDLYEERVIQQAIPRADDLEVEGARVAFAKKGLAPQQFHDAMGAAVREGRITREEYVDLTGADLILRGTTGRHAVFEVSIGPDRDDLDRTRRRAEVLARATGEEARPAVITPEPTAEFRRQAEGMGVAVMAIER